MQLPVPLIVPEIKRILIRLICYMSSARLRCLRWLLDMSSLPLHCLPFLYPLFFSPSLPLCLLRFHLCLCLFLFPIAKMQIVLPTFWGLSKFVNGISNGKYPSENWPKECVKRISEKCERWKGDRERETNWFGVCLSHFTLSFDRYENILQLSDFVRLYVKQSCQNFWLKKSYIL